ncbi:S66 family peptidase [Nocardioides jishulii]|uniref:LD-carboxypeptidase n=1 Tax=Nocardioides jishulii TaxID=2575440 RepID=A0A4U2YW69_9ACTN|nr:S66 peptidase family protein [Nocardioides jishulii]QCX28706.1 LD-carboxypeptidase [Nocardioides jishulii]TKI64401.1 LD-carboxypeptidase [Nocardioides jishulii]
MTRFPASLHPGDTIGVTAPSAGAVGAGMDRIRFCIDWLREQGYEVVVGDCLEGSGVTSAPVEQRAAELTSMLCDPAIRCVLPPWGGETAIDVVDLLDWDALAAAEPTWMVGYSDLSTLLLPITTRLDWATIHGDNLADTPYRPPAGLLSWLELASSPGPHLQRDSGKVTTWGDFATEPHAVEWRGVGEGSWRLHGADSLSASGRLIGGCVETVGHLAGTAYGDVAAFGQRHADDGLIVYLEACEDAAYSVCRHLHTMRLAGWFEHANAILIGRTRAPDSNGMTQDEAVLDALGRLDLPIVFDLEIGHVGPHLPLVNGALATVTVDGDNHTLSQELR